LLSALNIQKEATFHVRNVKKEEKAEHTECGVVDGSNSLR